MGCSGSSLGVDIVKEVLTGIAFRATSETGLTIIWDVLRLGLRSCC